MLPSVRRGRRGGAHRPVWPHCDGQSWWVCVWKVHSLLNMELQRLTTYSTFRIWNLFLIILGCWSSCRNLKVGLMSLMSLMSHPPVRHLQLASSTLQNRGLWVLEMECCHETTVPDNFLERSFVWISQSCCWRQKMSEHSFCLVFEAFALLFVEVWVILAEETCRVSRIARSLGRRADLPHHWRGAKVRNSIFMERWRVWGFFCWRDVKRRWNIM